MVQNKTDNYYVKAERNQTEGVYYVTDHVADKKDTTHFIPVASGTAKGKVIVKGLEDDTYVITELRTDSGYTLLKDVIAVIISQKETTAFCDIYAADVLGLIQNDPRYATIIKNTGDLHNMPQKHLERHLLAASATVDNSKVTMLADGSSNNAVAPLSVGNTRGFDLPKTGDYGTWMYSVGGILLMALAGGTLYFATCKKKLA